MNKKESLMKDELDRALLEIQHRENHVQAHHNMLREKLYFILALITGLLLNIVANIAYDRFIKGLFLIESTVVILSILFFALMIWGLYNSAIIIKKVTKEYDKSGRQYVKLKKEYHDFRYHRNK